MSEKGVPVSRSMVMRCVHACVRLFSSSVLGIIARMVMSVETRELGFFVTVWICSGYTGSVCNTGSLFVWMYVEQVWKGKEIGGIPVVRETPRRTADNNYILAPRRKEWGFLGDARFLLRV